MDILQWIFPALPPTSTLPPTLTDKNDPVQNIVMLSLRKPVLDIGKIAMNKTKSLPS